MIADLRTSWTASGRGEALRWLLAFQLERAPAGQALAAAHWLAENADTYRRHAGERTNLALTPGPSDAADFERVAEVLDSIARDPEQVFGRSWELTARGGMADLVAALGGAVGYERRH